MPKKKIEVRDIKKIEGVRGELREQARAFTSEVKGEWRKIERDWRKLRSQMAPARRTAEKSVTELKTASIALFDSIKKGYVDIKRSLRASGAKTRAPHRSPRRRAA